MIDLNIWPEVSQHSWKYRKRTRPIRILLVHAQLVERSFLRFFQCAARRLDPFHQCYFRFFLR